MAVRRLANEQPEDFTFTPENLAWAKAKIGDYPEGRQASAVIPLLWRAQEQNNGWLPEPAIRLVADMLEMPYIRVFEIATFYTMFQLQPVGSVAHIGVCGTTPCMLRGSEEIVAICKERIAQKPFELSSDGRFSWEEVECAGACVNAPMVQIGADTYEDLTPESFHALLDALGAGQPTTPGPQSARKGSEPHSGAKTLQSIEGGRSGEPAEVSRADDLPDKGLPPDHPAAANEFAGHPDASDRTEVEATRVSDAPPSTPSPAAPKPETNGRLKHGVDAPERQKAADAPGQTPDAKVESGPAGKPADEVGSAPDPTAPQTKSAEQADRDRASLGAERLGPTVTETEAARASGAPTTDADAGAHAAGTPPDEAAASRADAAGERPAVASETDEKDNLQEISGIGPVIERTLHSLGIYRFDQIAAWNRQNIEWVNAYLAFRGRIDREKWVEQAAELAKAGRDNAED